MKASFPWIALAALLCCTVCAVAATGPSAREWAEQERRASLQPIRPGEPGKRPFWNQYARRFIYAPAFDFKPVPGAAKYLFVVERGGQKFNFDADRPWASLAPVWDRIPEGYTRVTVEALDASGKGLGLAGERAFYRSPGFSGEVAPPAVPFAQAGRLGLRALFEAGHVQNWLKTGKPDPDYARYCYPAKVMGGLLRGMVAYARIAEAKADRQAAQEIARRVADYLLSISFPAESPIEFFPPTYALVVNQPTGPARNWLGRMMMPAACDVAFGYLDLFDLGHDQRYLEAAKKIAATYAKTQESDGTWPLKVEAATGKAVAPNRMVPTWVIWLFDRLDRQYGDKSFRSNRQRAWQFIVEHPLRTYAWDGQFEDVKPRPPYRNLAREQACDTAVILLEQANGDPAQIAKAKELIRFAEDQFVVWSPIRDLPGARKIRFSNRHLTEWITPCVLEQYVCYGPVARSSAVLIHAYVVAHKVTGDELYLRKAEALAGSLVAGQRYQMKYQHGDGEIPTWLYRDKPTNWLNNSYYAAAALLEVADAARP